MGCNCNKRPIDTKILDTISIDSQSQWDELKIKYNLTDNKNELPFFLIITQKLDNSIHYEIIYA